MIFTPLFQRGVSHVILYTIVLVLHNEIAEQDCIDNKVHEPGSRAGRRMDYLFPTPIAYHAITQSPD